MSTIAPQAKRDIVTEDKASDEHIEDVKGFDRDARVQKVYNVNRHPLIPALPQDVS